MTRDSDKEQSYFRQSRDGDVDLTTEATEWQSASRFSFISIRWKILVIALIAAIAFASYLGFNLIQANSQAILLEDIRDKRYPLQVKLQEALFSLRLIQTNLQDAVLTGEAESLQQAVLLKRQFNETLMEVEAIDTDKSTTVLQIQQSFDKYYDASYQLAMSLINGEVQMVWGSV